MALSHGGETEKKSFIILEMHHILCDAPFFVLSEMPSTTVVNGARLGGHLCPVPLSRYDLVIKGRGGVIIIVSLAIPGQGAIKAKWRRTLFQPWWQSLKALTRLLMVQSGQMGV